MFILLYQVYYFGVCLVIVYPPPSFMGIQLRPCMIYSTLPPPVWYIEVGLASVGDDAVKHAPHRVS